jgi:hypothetical protein
MRNLIYLAAFSAALAITPALHAAGKTDVKGEIVDTFCYLSMGAKGPSHATCGKECAKKGIPVGLLNEKKDLYVLLPAKDHSPLPAAVIENMGKTVTVSGEVIDKGGSHFLKVDAVK